jgi:hypothetical protein
VTPVKYVGIDVHKKMCQAAILDEDGALLDEIRFANDPEEIEEFAGKLSTFQDEVRAVVESTGNLWIQIHDRLEEHGFEVALSNPAKTRLIAEAKVKTDKVDARTLAGLLSADMIPTCSVSGEELRSRRELLRHRLRLVRTRTEVKNRIHSLLDKHGLRMPSTTSFSKDNVAWLRGLSLAFIFVGLNLKIELLYNYFLPIAALTLFIMATRYLKVFGLARIIENIRGKSIPGNWRIGLWWSGIRGAVSVVLVRARAQGLDT